MGRSKKRKLVEISKEIWQCILQRKISSTDKYLSGFINVKPDEKFKQTRDFNKLELNVNIFMQLLQIRAIPKLVLFTSTFLFASQKIDPFIQGRDAFHKSQSRKFIYSFPHFLLIVQVFQKVNPYQDLMLIITPAWPSQQRFLELLKISVKNQLFLQALKDLLKDRAGKLNLLLMQTSLQLMGWKISERTYFQKEYQKGVPSI